jgi:hypothetical protein
LGQCKCNNTPEHERPKDLGMEKSLASGMAQELHATAGYAKDTVVYFLGWAKQLPEGSYRRAQQRCQ